MNFIQQAELFASIHLRNYGDISRQIYSEGILPKGWQVIENVRDEEPVRDGDIYIGWYWVYKNDPGNSVYLRPSNPLASHEH